MIHQATETKAAPAGLGLKALAGIFRRVWPYLIPQWKHLLVLLGMYAVLTVAAMIGGMILFDLVNNKIILGKPLEAAQAAAFGLDSSYVETDTLSDEQRRVVGTRTMIYVVPFMVLSILLFLVVVAPYYKMWIVQRINQHLRVTMIERAEHLSLRYHSHARTGDAIYRVFQDSAMITQIIATWIIDPLQQGTVWLVAILIVWLFSPMLGLVCLIATIPILLLLAWYTPRLQRRARMARESNSGLTSRIQEASASIRVIKAMQAEATVMDRFNRDSSFALDNAFMLRLEILFLRTAVVFITGTVYIATICLMTRWTINEESTWLAGSTALAGFAIWNLGSYQAARNCTEGALGGWQGLLVIWSIVQDMSTGLGRAFFLLDLEPEVRDAEDAVTMPAPIREVTYSNLHFGYEADRPVLQGVNLEARAGTITAIVGATGAGKSTLTSMLLRLYDPDEGTVAVNGADLKGIRIDDLRANVAIALQQNVLFATTVAENIGYATKNASRESIEAAAKIACAHAFIEDMEKGYDTELGERGGKLSTGQRQRLTIARAIVRDTPILILDEPTAALDAETEKQVLENLAGWGSDRVLFLITHRLSTIRSADQVAFLEDGRIVEVGDHDAPDVALICSQLTLQPVFALLNAAVSLYLLNYCYGAIAPELVWIAASLVPVAFLITLPASGLARRVNQASRAAGTATTNAIEESMSNIHAVQSLGGMQHEKARIEGKSGESFRRYRLVRLVEIGIAALSVSLLIGFIFFVIVLVADHIIEGGMSAGDFVVLLGLAMSIGVSAAQIGFLWIQVQGNVAAVRRVFFFIDLESEDPVEGLANLAGVQQGVRFENVDFSYPNGHRALQGINLDLAIGELVAIVGPTGAGKTSLAYLIPGFYHPTRGRVLIDGQDIADLNLDSVRAQVSYVFQEHLLLNESIRGNLLLANPKATETDMLVACRTAGAMEFIETLPEGLDTELGRSGDTLSVGQQQRLCIARGLIRDTKILILDEPTAALDPQTENALVRALLQAAKDRLVIVIAHRLSTIRQADRIIFLDGGEVKDIGDHDALMEDPDSPYRRFVELQGG